MMPEDNQQQPAEVKSSSLQPVEDLTAELEKAKQRLEETENKIKEGQDRFLRAQAELQNVLKRAERDVENAYKYALERFVVELLPVIDSLEKAVSAAETNEGVRLTLEMFLKVLSKFGVHPICPDGKSFDPNLHEAVTVQESAEVKPNTVLQVLQKGYSLRDRVVRAARVIVSKAPLEKQ